MNISYREPVIPTLVIIVGLLSICRIVFTDLVIILINTAVISSDRSK